jgi:hypothetical protein
MKEQTISYPTSVLAKEKGYFEWSPRRFNKTEILQGIEKIENTPCIKYTLSQREVPMDKTQVFVYTQSIIQKWIRDIHDVQIEIRWNFKRTYFFTYIKEYNKSTYYSNLKLNETLYETYEDCLEAALLYALEKI